MREVKGTAYFKDGRKMYKVLCHVPKNKLTKEMWLLWVYRNDVNNSLIPKFFREKGRAIGLDFGRLHFSKATNKHGVL